MFKYRYPLRTLVLLSTLIAIAFFLLSSTSYTFRTDLSVWTREKQILPNVPSQLLGQRMHIVRPGNSTAPYATHLQVIAVDASDLENAKITVRLKPWQKWILERANPVDVEWECPPFGRGTVHN